MSGKNNVNPGQYKVAGREKPSKPLGPEAEDKESFAKARKQERGGGTPDRPAPKENRKR